MNIVIVSIYGRGYWLAFELSRMGYSVILVELDSNLTFTLEDIEGPFGAFKTRLLESFADRLENESPLLHTDNGFTIWLKDSIYEFKGPLSNFQLSNIDKSVIDYLNNPSNLSINFDKSWLAHLSCQLSSTVFKHNANCLNHGSPMPVFNPFYYRLITRRNFFDFKNKLKSLGITIYNLLDDFSTNSNTINIKDSIFEYKNLIWMLTSFETDYFLPNLRKKIFDKVIEPVWYWVRYNISFSSKIFDVLPPHFVNINDIYLPWSHENLMILQKTIINNHMNCWLRLPSNYNNDNYKKQSLKIKQILENKINDNIQIVSIPKKQDINIFPVYNDKIIFKNDLLIDSPETWDSLSWNGQCISNEQTLNNIKESLGQD